MSQFKLLPDDPEIANTITGLQNALARTIEERDNWRGYALTLERTVHGHIGAKRAAEEAARV